MSQPQQAQVISIADQRAARQARDPDRGRPGTAGDRGVGAARPKCSATTAEGRSCRNYAVDQGRCRVHAIREPGAASPTPGGSTAGAEEATSSASRGGPGGFGSGHGPRSAAAGATGSTAGGPDAAGPAGDGRAAGGGAASSADPFREAARFAAEHGWGQAVDAFAALRDVAGDGWIDHARDAVAFARRRLTGDYDIDAFGFDEDLTTNVLMPLLRPLHRHYWRVASHGVANVPTDGGGLLVANHAGTLPADAMITRLDIFDQTGRHARELGADLVYRTPFVGEFARKTGATLASGDDADRLLANGELVAVWPEGFKGIGKPWKDRYKLQRFGRGGFVATALRAQVPIIPTAIVGSEEIYPLLFDLKLLAKIFGFPYFPIVPQMFALPVLGPLALLPLPSKWIIEYGDPIDTAGYGPEAAEDPMAVFDLTDRVRDTIQEMLYRNLMGRRSVFL
jgi:1-acyl-sn-glycerol-3-phosphate acyltransferase